MLLTPEMLLEAYRQGYFPMAPSRADMTLHWFCPEMRGVLPLNDFHIPRSLAKRLRKNPYQVTFNTAFDEVILACATIREESWINPQILSLYGQLHRMGYAHSVECWGHSSLIGATAPNPTAPPPHTCSVRSPTRCVEPLSLLGGLYGLAIGGAFFGESMFSRATDASKIALVYLVERLKECGYVLLDTQFNNDHIAQFGVVEIPRSDYLRQLRAALEVNTAAL